MPVICPTRQVFYKIIAGQAIRFSKVIARLFEFLENVISLDTPQERIAHIIPQLFFGFFEIDP